MKSKCFMSLSLLIVLSLSLTSSLPPGRSISDIIRIFKDPTANPNYTLIAAHRGYWRRYPENSTGAYDDAIAIGADIVEMDVRFTSDDTLVVMHDACLDRVTTGSGFLRSKSLSQIRPLFLKNHLGHVTHYKILTLSEGLDYLKGKALMSLDIKETDGFDQAFIQAIKLCRDKGVLDQVIIKGKKRKAKLDILLAKAGVTLQDFLYTPIIFGDKRRSDPANFDAYLSEILDWATNRDIYAAEFVYKQTADPLLTGNVNIITQAKQNGLWIGQYSFWPEECAGVSAQRQPLSNCDFIYRAYDFQDADPTNFLDDGRGDWDFLMKYGANYVITDRPALLMNYTQAMGKRTLGN